jgi:hypothetical protein
MKNKLTILIIVFLQNYTHLIVNDKKIHQFTMYRNALINNPGLNLKQT